MGRIILFGTGNKKYWIDQIITLHICIKKVTSKTGIFLYQHGFYSCAERRKISWNILWNMVNVRSAKPISINVCLFLSDICKFVLFETLVFAGTIKVFVLLIFHSAKKGTREFLEVFVNLECNHGNNLITKTFTRNK